MYKINILNKEGMLSDEDRKEKLLKLLKSLPLDSKLDSQIMYMEMMNSIITTPITLAILESLKELRGINKNKIKKWEQEQKDK